MLPFANVAVLPAKREKFTVTLCPAPSDEPIAPPRPPVFVAELTGIHPTREGLFVQAALLAVYLGGAAYVFGWKPARRRVAEARAA